MTQLFLKAAYEKRGSRSSIAHCLTSNLGVSGLPGTDSSIDVVKNVIQFETFLTHLPVIMLNVTNIS